MRQRAMIGTAILAAVMGAGAASAAPTDMLREALALTPPEAQLVSYAVADAEAQIWVDALSLGLSGDTQAMEALFGPAPPQAVLSYRIMEVNASGRLWVMADAAAAEALPPYLARYGFAQDGAAWRRGTYGQMDFKAVDPANPFLGGMGMGNAVFARGRVVAQVFDPAREEAVATITPEQSLLHMPGMQAALAGLDGVEGASLQTAFPLVSGTEAGDPAVAMGLREAQPGAGEGAQGWTRALVAQVQQGGAPATVLSVAFPDCAAAEAGARQIAAVWTQLPEIGATVSTLPVAETAEGCAAVLTSDAPGAARAVHSRVMGRDFTPLYGAMP